MPPAVGGVLPLLRSAGEIARSVREGGVLVVEIVRDTFERIDKLNPELNALIALRRDEAVAEAVQLDRRVASGHTLGPLAGVPFTVKDMIATSGLATTCGSWVIPGRLTDVDATAVRRMRAAGAILVGKSNCSEFAFSIETTNSRYGPTTNPVGHLTPGGSSGGEAVALAAGLSTGGLGTDLGGSVRWPAQCTGIVGLRPTVGRVPGSGQLPSLDDTGPHPPNPRSLQGRLQVIGPMARTVDDVELVLRVVAGADDVDPAAVPVPLASSSTVRLGDAELCWATAFGGVVADDVMSSAVAGAIDVVAPSFANVLGGAPEALNRAHDLYSSIRECEPLVELRAAMVGHEKELTASVQRILASARSESENQLVSWWAERDRLRHELLGWLQGERLLALPVSVVPPSRPGEPRAVINGRQMTEPEVVAPCRVVSLFGLPAVAVPCGTTGSGRPVSLQFVGPPFREDLVLAAAKCLERAMLAKRGAARADVEEP